MTVASVVLLLIGIAITVAPFVVTRWSTEERQLRESFIYNYGSILSLLGIAIILISVV